MNRFRNVRLVMAVAILVLLHFSLRPALDWRVSIDFLVIALLMVAIRMRPALAAVTGFLLGILSDVQSPAAIGASALALTVVGFAASHMRTIFFSDRVALTAFMLFAGKLLYDILFAFAVGLALDQPFELLLWSPLGALVTAVAGVLLLAFLKPLLRRTGQ